MNKRRLVANLLYVLVLGGCHVSERTERDFKETGLLFVDPNFRARYSVPYFGTAFCRAQNGAKLVVASSNLEVSPLYASTPDNGFNLVVQRLHGSAYVRCSCDTASRDGSIVLCRHTTRFRSRYGYERLAVQGCDKIQTSFQHGELRISCAH